MKPSEDPKLLELVKTTGEIYGKQLSLAAALVFLADLDEHDSERVKAALADCRKTLRYFPTVADVVARIQASDGRPGVEEAWALIPEGEGATVCWTEEVASAYAQVAPLYADDRIAARMAFKEIYPKLVEKNRFYQNPVRWTVSLGHDSAGRESVVREAARLGRIPQDSADRLLAPPISEQGLALVDGLNHVFHTILEDAPSRLVAKHAARNLPDPTESEIEERKRVLREQAKALDGDK